MSIRRKKVALCRSLGMNVVGTQRDPLARRRHPPGQHGVQMARRRRKPSDYKLRLVEKQRLRALYNLRERQFANTVRRAKAKSGPAQENLLRMLESRLDTVAYRAGFARTQREARQLVGHGHFTVNGRKVNRPSFEVRPGDEVALKPTSQDQAFFKEKAKEVFGRGAPGWMVVNPDKWTARVERLPEMEEVPMAEELVLGYIMEYYA